MVTYVHPMIFRRRRIRLRNKKYCAVIKAEERTPCSPWGYHCKHGLSCKKSPAIKTAATLQQLFFPTNNLDFPTYGGRGRPGGANGRQFGRGQRRPNRGGGGILGGGNGRQFGRGPIRPNGGVLGGVNGGGGVLGRPNGAGGVNGGLFGKLDRKKGEFESRRFKRQTQFDYQYPNDDYLDGADQPFGLDNLFGFQLTDRLKTRLETQFRKHQCVKLKLSGDGSGETCTNSVECRCGEFCSKPAQRPNSPGKCKPATCSLRGSGVCQAYPGFNHK